MRKEKPFLSLEDFYKRLSIENSSKKVAKYLENVKEELKTFGRITGHKDIHELSVEDLATTSNEISQNTNIKHV